MSPPRCNEKMDVVIVVDSSKNVGDFTQIKELVKNILEQYDVVNNTRVAIVNYGKTPEYVVSLHENNTHKSLFEKVNEIPQKGEEPRLDKALTMVTHEIFNVDIDDEYKHAPKVLYIIKEVEPLKASGHENIPKIIDRFDEHHVQVVPIVIGEEPNKDLLENIASKPGFITTADTSKELVDSKEIKETVDKTCKKRKYI